MCILDEGEGAIPSGKIDHRKQYSRLLKATIFIKWRKVNFRNHYLFSWCGLKEYFSSPPGCRCRYIVYKTIRNSHKIHLSY